MMCAIGWSFIALMTASFAGCGLFALAACILSGRISRDEEGDIYSADEGATAACLRRDDVGGQLQHASR